MEWNFFTDNEDALIWHWGYKHGWATRHKIVGWDECLIAYVLGAASPTFPIKPDAYHKGWTAGRTFQNGKELLRPQAAARPRFRRPAVLLALSVPGPRSARA